MNKRSQIKIAIFALIVTMLATPRVIAQEGPSLLDRIIAPFSTEQRTKNQLADIGARIAQASIFFIDGEPTELEEMRAEYDRLKESYTKNRAETETYQGRVDRLNTWSTTYLEIFVERERLKLVSYDVAIAARLTILVRLLEQREQIVSSIEYFRSQITEQEAVIQSADLSLKEKNLAIKEIERLIDIELQRLNEFHKSAMRSRQEILDDIETIQGEGTVMNGEGQKFLDREVKENLKVLEEQLASTEEQIDEIEEYRSRRRTLLERKLERERIRSKEIKTKKEEAVLLLEDLTPLLDSNNGLITLQNKYLDDVENRIQYYVTLIKDHQRDMEEKNKVLDDIAYANGGGGRRSYIYVVITRSKGWDKFDLIDGLVNKK